MQMSFGSLSCCLVPTFLLQKNLASQEAVTIVQSMLRELLRGILTPERAQSPVDAYLTEEDLFHHRNPQVQAQHWPLSLLPALGKRNSKPSNVPGPVLSVFHE